MSAPLPDLIAEAQSNDELAALWRAHRDAWTDTLTAAVQARLEVLAGSAGANAYRAYEDVRQIVTSLTPAEAFAEGVEFALHFDELMAGWPTPGARRAVAAGYLTAAGVVV